MDRQSRLGPERLGLLEPLSSLSQERLTELSEMVHVERLGLGASLFRIGDLDNETVYLLAGEVNLVNAGGEVERVVKAGSEQARFPLDESQPHQRGAVALTPVEVLRIDNNVLDYMLAWDQLAVIEPPAEAGASAETGSDSDWIRRMRHIMAFKNLPPANVRPLLERMEPVPVRAGQTVVRQGDAGDYYYVLVEGSARVTRTLHLADLEPGASFGEEALISGGARNATVTMATDGVLMRLAKTDFDAFLREPLLERVTPEQARRRLENRALWLDVRHAREFAHQRLPGALNIPLNELRSRLDELDRGVDYLCCCRTGQRSAAAAFILKQAGYRAAVLSGGMQVLPASMFVP